jgi:hypothetical protein
MAPCERNAYPVSRPPHAARQRRRRLRQATARCRLEPPPVALDIVGGALLAAGHGQFLWPGRSWWTVVVAVCGVILAHLSLPRCQVADTLRVCRLAPDSAESAAIAARNGCRPDGRGRRPPQTGLDVAAKYFQHLARFPGRGYCSTRSLTFPSAALRLCGPRSLSVCGQSPGRLLRFRDAGLWSLW